MTGWVSISRASLGTGRARSTVWQWVTDGLVSCRCRVSDHRVEVWYFDVLDLADQQPTRKRPAA